MQDNKHKKFIEMEKRDLMMMSIPDQGILPLFFHKDSVVCREVLLVLYDAGIRIVEFTNRGREALNNFREMRKLCNDELKGMSLGVGTLKKAEEAREYIIEGADFIVSPGLVDEIIDVADKHETLCIPGCMTPSEIIHAENKGLKMIKLFPGNLLGAKFVSSIRSIFPDLMFIPTGGVDLDKENISGWFKAGVCAVGMGSKLIRKDLLEQKDFKKIKELTMQTMKIVSEVREK